MATGGMLGELFSPKYKDLLQEERDQEQVHQFQAQDPFAAMAHASYSGGTMAGKGLGRAVASAAGVDPRTSSERTAGAVDAAKAEVSKLGFNPEDPKSIDEFYKRVIQILQKQGLAAEAMTVAKEWRALKQADDKHSIETEKLKRQRDRDTLVNARAAERNEILKAKLGQAASPVGKLIQDMERTEDPAMRAHFAKAISNATAGKWEAVDLGDRVQLRNTANPAEIIDTIEKGAAPMNAKDTDKKIKADESEKSAYLEIKADMQRQIDKSAELHNHPGVDDMTGLLDQYVGEQTATGFVAGALSSDAGAAAAELWKSIVGGTFLAGLAKLKAASKTGSTGLGAVSEREGDKVQSDAAALGRPQKGADFRLRLRQYIQLIVEGGARLDAKASEAGVSAQPLTVPPLSRGGRPSNKPPAPRPAPAPAASAAPAAAGGMDAAKKRRLEELRRKRDQGTLK